jgi:molecular chaperone GrpE
MLVLNLFAPKHRMKPTNDSTAPADPPAAPAAVPATPTTPAYTPEQIEEFKTKAAAADENWDRLLRTTADFDNFKKRAARERAEAAQSAVLGLVQKLLPVLDGFDMAQTAAQNPAGDKLASLQTGVAMIQTQLKNFISEAGVEEVDALGRAFDPALHEAISQQDSADAPEGRVLQQLRKGYKMRDRLLRPATVIVARKPEPKP